MAPSTPRSVKGSVKSIVDTTFERVAASPWAAVSGSSFDLRTRFVGPRSFDEAAMRYVLVGVSSHRLTAHTRLISTCGRGPGLCEPPCLCHGTQPRHGRRTT